jgi:hypothetical protein
MEGVATMTLGSLRGAKRQGREWVRLSEGVEAR